MQGAIQVLGFTFFYLLYCCWIIGSVLTTCKALYFTVTETVLECSFNQKFTVKTFTWRHSAVWTWCVRGTCGARRDRSVECPENRCVPDSSSPDIHNRPTLITVTTISIHQWITIITFFQGWKLDTVGRYTIPAVPWSAWNHTAISRLVCHKANTNHSACQPDSDYTCWKTWEIRMWSVCGKGTLEDVDG